MSDRFRLGVDVGGTFTDAVLISETSGEARVAKVSSTPADPSVGFLRAVARILHDADVQPSDVSYLVHGTTVATNALIEGTTPPAAFITTEGFRDLLEIGRQVRPSLYDVFFEKPRPLVSRDRCLEVRERLDASGGVLVPLDEAAVRRIAHGLASDGIESVAVCLLHAYLNPVHEERIAELLLEVHPGLSVSLSSHVCPEFREFFRASTTVINASIRPVVGAYLRHIETRLAGEGLAAELLVMQSNGGVLTFAAAADRPVYMVESGPAAGVMAAGFLADGLGHRDVVAFDMGGTTAKVGLIVGGRPSVTKEYEVGAQALPGLGQSRGSGYPIRTPVIDLVEIGAGGGSVAWVDVGGILRVGPRSAGADPGPIGYARGGTEPTITDANLVLRRIDPRHFLGGEMSLDVDLAREGIRARCAEPLGMDVVEAASGIVEIANAAMINALRVVTVRRGHDPRELVMVAFGGAGPLHANRLCADMQIRTLIIPPSPGTFSALGLLVTDLKHEFSRTRLMTADRAELEALDAIFSGMETAGRDRLLREGIAASAIRYERQIEMRYTGQSYELPVEVPPGDVTADVLRAVVARFHGEHDRAYGHGFPDEPVELVNVLVSAIGTITKPARRKLPRDRIELGDARRGTAPVFFSEARGFLDTAIFTRGGLGAGDRFEGPAIVEEMDSTSLIHPGFRVEVDAYGNLVVTPVA